MGAWIETNRWPSYRQSQGVAPRVGAWIETLPEDIEQEWNAIVAPRVGAWIETTEYTDIIIIAISVAPRVGAWIETVYSIMIIPLPMRRTPCGCVD